MRFLPFFFTLLGLAESAPQFEFLNDLFKPPGVKTDISLGTGPYKSHYFEDPSLPRHTIYQPKVTAGLKIPVVVWGNPGCYALGEYSVRFLAEVASYGVMLIAPGNIGDFGSFTDPSWLTDSIDWVTANAGRGNYSHVVGNRIGAWGRSCGGLEALEVAQDPRIGHIGVFNAGWSHQEESTAIMGRIRKPVFYFMGGERDFAEPYADADYVNLPPNTPAWKGSNGKGHDNDHEAPNGGSMAHAAVMLARWMLRGDFTARNWFSGPGARADGWDNVIFKNLPLISVFPI